PSAVARVRCCGRAPELCRLLDELAAPSTQRGFQMATFTWTTGTSGDWNTAANWGPATIPNSGTAEVVIDAAPVGTNGYTVTIANGASDMVQSLTLNPTNNLLGVLATPYNAAALEVDGTLTFAPGTDGTLGGPLQNLLVMNNGTIVNAGTVNAFIQGVGNDLFTGTNGIYVTNWLQALGTVTIDTKTIAEMAGTTLFDGIFEAKGPGATINLGGTLQGLAVDITAMQGPTLIPDGWTELTLNAPGSEINEWNGTAYVPIEQTLSSIQARATLDVLGGRDYTTANALAIGSGALLNLEAGTIATGGLTVDAGGLVKGTATIGGVITDNGTLSASGAGLVLSGTVNGTGNLTFDPAGGTLEVANVGSSVTVTMHGNDTLKLDNPATFLGTIAAQIGDSILLQGLTATSAVLNAGTLVVSNGTTVVDSLALAGTYTGDSFTVDSSGGAARITIGVPPATTYTWASGKDGDWNTAANWGPATIPNGGGAAVVIDAAPVGTNGYTVTIANGASDMVQ